MTDEGDLSGVVKRLRDFVSQRDWAQFHDPKNLSMAIASEAGELLSELRWVTSADSERLLEDKSRRAQVENEVADIAIALLLFCDRTGIDLLSSVDRKMQLNEANYPVGEAKGRSERPAPRLP